MMGNPKNKRDSELYQFNTGSRTTDEEQQTGRTWSHLRESNLRTAKKIFCPRTGEQCGPLTLSSYVEPRRI